MPASYAMLTPQVGTSTNCAAADIIAKAASGTLKASAGNLYNLYVTNTNVAAQFYALVDKATAPVNGDTPVMYFAVPIGVTFRLEYVYGKHFVNGISWAQVTGIAATITLATADTVVSAEVK